MARRCIWGRYRSVFRGDSSGKTGHIINIVPLARPGTGFKRWRRQATHCFCPGLGHPCMQSPTLAPPWCLALDNAHHGHLFVKLNLTWDNGKFCGMLRAVLEPQSLWPEALDRGSGKPKPSGMSGETGVSKGRSGWGDWARERGFRAEGTGRTPPSRSRGTGRTVSTPAGVPHTRMALGGGRSVEPARPTLQGRSSTWHLPGPLPDFRVRIL